jgi:hypothetical protein
MRRVHLEDGTFLDEVLNLEFDPESKHEAFKVIDVCWVPTHTLRLVDNWGSGREDWDLVEVSEAVAIGVEVEAREFRKFPKPVEELLHGQRTDVHMPEPKKWWQRGSG